MKAAVFYGKGDIRIEERPMPKAGPGQMVVKIDYCGVCGTGPIGLAAMQIAKNGSQVILVGIVGEPLDMLASGKLHFPGMVTDVIALDDVVEKGVARQDRKGQLKILIDPSL